MDSAHLVVLIVTTRVGDRARAHVLQVLRVRQLAHIRRALRRGEPVQLAAEAHERGLRAAHVRRAPPRVHGAVAGRHEVHKVIRLTAVAAAHGVARERRAVVVQGRVHLERLLPRCDERRRGTRGQRVCRRDGNREHGGTVEHLQATQARRTHGHLHTGTHQRGCIHWTSILHASKSNPSSKHHRPAPVPKHQAPATRQPAPLSRHYVPSAGRRAERLHRGGETRGGLSSPAAALRRLESRQLSAVAAAAPGRTREFPSSRCLGRDASDDACSCTSARRRTERTCELKSN